MTSDNEEFYQDPAAERSGNAGLTPLSDVMRRPEMIEPETTECIDCGAEFLGERWNYPVRVPRDNFPGTTWGSEVRFVHGGRCPKCVARLEEEERQAAETARQIQLSKVRTRWRKTCGVPLKYLNEDFSTFNVAGDRRPFKTARDAALSYADEFPLETAGRGSRSLVLFSEHSWGVGKTHLAAAIAHRVLDRWDGKPDYRPVLMISEYEILDRITATYNYTNEEKQYRQKEEDIIKELLFVPLLIIDDVGKHPARDLRFMQRKMFSIIDKRDNAMRPVVMTANLDAEGLGRYLGGVDPKDPRDRDADEAVLDRLIGMCGGRFTQLDGKSYRRLRQEARHGKK